MGRIRAQINRRREEIRSFVDHGSAVLVKPTVSLEEVGESRSEAKKLMTDVPQMIGVRRDLHVRSIERPIGRSI